MGGIPWRQVTGGRWSPLLPKNGGGTTLTSFGYTYANPSTGADTGLRRTMTDTAGRTTTYTYDALDRLTRAQNPSADVQYAYDGSGNRTSQTANGTTTTNTYNAANEITAAGGTTYAYDADGNATGNSAGLALAYDARNHTASATPPGGAALALGYRGDTQIQRTTAGGTTFGYGALGLRFQTAGGQTTYYTRDNKGVLAGQRAPSGTFYYLYDGLGNAAAVTDNAGSVVATYAYEPYGKLAASTGSIANPWQYGGAYGAYTDTATGLLKIGHRFYDPALGRWTQHDPVRHLGDPRQANRYTYAGCDPIDLIDPSGASDCSATTTFGAGVVFVGTVALLGIELAGAIAAPEVAPAEVGAIYATGTIAGGAEFQFLDCVAG